MQWVVLFGAAERVTAYRFRSDSIAIDLLPGYRDLYAKLKLPLQTIKHVSTRSIPDLQCGIYYLLPATAHQLHPSDDNKCRQCTQHHAFTFAQRSVVHPRTPDRSPTSMSAARRRADFRSLNLVLRSYRRR